MVVLTTVALLVAAAGTAHAADPARDRQWALDAVRATAAHTTGQGAGVVIAVVDSGVDLDHEDLAANLVPGIDVVDGDDRPQDEFGHGTHVAGIAAAVGGNRRGIVGVAPRASIMPVRVLDEDGTGTSSDVSEGVRWAVDNGADVVNLSLGQAAQGVFGSSLTEAIRYAWDRGAVVVVAAGNEFVLSSGFEDEPALVVSATTRDGGKPDYSNGVGGARWGMAAPGGGCRLLTCPTEDDVFSTWWEDGEDDVYAYLAGTSMAAPHVAGAAAVLLGLGLGPQQTVDRLLATARDIGPDGRDSTFGAGLLDLGAAVRGLSQGPAPATAGGAATAPTPDAAPPAASPSPTPTPSAPPTAAPSPTPAGDEGAGASEPADVVPSPTGTPSDVRAAPTTSPSAARASTPSSTRTGLLVAALVAVVAAGAGVASAGSGTRRR